MTGARLEYLVCHGRSHTAQCQGWLLVSVQLCSEGSLDVECASCSTFVLALTALHVGRGTAWEPTHQGAAGSIYTQPKQHGEENGNSWQPRRQTL